MWPKYPILLAMFHRELDEAKVVYDHHLEAQTNGKFFIKYYNYHILLGRTFSCQQKYATSFWKFTLGERAEK